MSGSILGTGPVGSSEGASAANQGDVVDGQARTSQPDSVTSFTEYEEARPGNSESLSPQNIESFEDIGLLQRDSPPYSSVEPQQLQNQSNLPSFSVSPTNKYMENLSCVLIVNSTQDSGCRFCKICSHV